MVSITRLTSTVVKTRRLYYLYEMSRFLELNQPSSPNILQNHMLQFAEEYRDNFKRYKDSTGEISTKSAFNKYLKFAIDIGFIKALEHKLLNTTDGAVLSKLNFEKKEPYYLSNSLKYFFLKKILEKDFDYITIIINLALSKTITTSNFVQKLKEKIFSEGISVRTVDILSDINSWKSPKRYFRENIYAPRRSWLIDLDLISSSIIKGKSRIYFKNNPYFLTNKIASINKKEFYSYLKYSYYSDIAKFYLKKSRFKYFSNLSFESKRKKILDGLNIIFNYLGFSTNKISSKFFFEYIPIRFLCIDKIVVEENELEEELLKISSLTNTSFRYRPAKEITPSGEKIDVGYINILR